MAVGEYGEGCSPQDGQEANEQRRNWRPAETFKGTTYLSNWIPPPQVSESLKIVHQLATKCSTHKLLGTFPMQTVTLWELVSQRALLIWVAFAVSSLLCWVWLSLLPTWDNGLLYCACSHFSLGQALLTSRANIVLTFIISPQEALHFFLPRHLAMSIESIVFQDSGRCQKCFWCLRDSGQGC